MGLEDGGDGGGVGFDDGGYAGFDHTGFGEASVRRNFIRKVYGILSVQLAVTCGIIGLFFIRGVREFATAPENQWLFWLSFVAVIVCIIALACCGEIRRKTPHNFIFLGVFTLAEGFLLGCATAQYSADAVLLAAGITTIIVFALTIFAFQTKIDFTPFSGILFVFLICLMLFGLGFAFFGPSTRAAMSTVNIVYSSIGAFIFAAYLVIDTQLMMGGKHKYRLGPEEYIFAALNLYLDIINLFMYILSIIGNSRN